jgi:conjugative transfer signal peptidase TraF
MNIRQFWRKTTIGFAYVGFGVMALGAMAWAAGARINTTPSIPVGLYWVTHKPIEKGEYVMFCPPKAAIFDTARERGYIDGGFCAGDYSYMMKRVLAAKSDVVTVTHQGVFVNGKRLPYSTPLAVDPGDRPMPMYHAQNLKLTAKQLFLMTDVNPLSFDGRYFGPVDKSQIKAVIRPIYTW